MLLAAFVMVALTSASAAGNAPVLGPQIHKAHWIWLKGFEGKSDAKVYLREKFSLDFGPAAASLRVTCRGGYQIWINGVLAVERAAGGAEAKRAFDAMMTMKKIDAAAIDAARRG